MQKPLPHRPLSLYLTSPITLHLSSLQGTSTYSTTGSNHTIFPDSCTQTLPTPPYTSPLQLVQGAAPTRPLAATTPCSLIFALKPHPPPVFLSCNCCKVPAPIQPVAATAPSSLMFALKPRPPPYISPLQLVQGASPTPRLAATTPPSLIFTFKPRPPPYISPLQLVQGASTHLTIGGNHTTPQSRAPPCILFCATHARCPHLLDGWQQPHAHGRHARVALRAAAPPSYIHRAQEGHGPAARPAVQQGALHCCIARFAGGHVSLHFDLLLLLHCRALPSHLQRETA